ncbi:MULTISPECIES: PilW family protein [Aeromonas]|uniref:PilW family protein n=1 Tax=Aeromonas TaxID=642 RepID=UPI00227A78C2|nr:type II secretion system protein [Aeromonas dhakensis]WAG11475.1 type II secretion system GspH family protein [Aeromonas dhakensis]WDF95051.1 type II secretion system protein [Aeromonas dhakensis]BEE01578.1 MSHA biogenesis protein MshO [Aeromonas dhakensis]HDX8594225.1 type II secretion system protein [Aeromonas dhakensis]HDZ8878402.1 type II secretion system protein [Aeromonas dhakensis]
MRTAGGFTLIELVMVILLLGIMATFASQFIGIGSQIYGDASSREQLMSDARFAMERLNREVRNALPGSERIETLDGSWSDSGPCLRFWPISTSSRYIALNRNVSGSTTTLELVMATPASAVDPFSPDASAVAVGDLLAVFPLPDANQPALSNGCEYGRCVARVTEVLAPVSGAQTLRYAATESLAGLSPGSRVYFAREQVRYCVQAGSMYRASMALNGTSAAMPLGILMADSLRAGSFYREATAFNSEGEFGVRLVFERKGEAVTFNHKLGVFNVP